MNKFKKDQQVMIITGKDKGKEGKIIKVLPTEQKVLIENLNTVKRAIKPTKENQGGLVDLPAKIHWSNVMVIDPKDNKPSRVGIKEIKNKKERISKRSKEIV